MDILTENELIKKIQQKDKFAETNFYSAYYPKIKMIIAMRVNQFEDREELANDILMAAIIKIKEGRYDSDRDSNLAKYIHGIARNIITQYYRDFYRAREREKILCEELKESSDVYNKQNELEENEEFENRQKIWRDSINKLKPKYRKVVYLRYYKNLSVAEISEVMNITAQKVSDYLKYSKKLLQQITKKFNK